MEPYGVVLLQILAVQPYLRLHPGQQLFHMFCSSFSPTPQHSSLHLFTCFPTLDVTICKIHLLPTTSSPANLQIHWTTYCSQKTSLSVLPLGLCTCCFLFLDCLSAVSVETHLSFHLDTASHGMLDLTPYSQASLGVLIIVCLTARHDFLKTQTFQPINTRPALKAGATLVHSWSPKWSKTVLNPGLINEWA